MTYLPTMPIAGPNRMRDPLDRVQSLTEKRESDADLHWTFLGRPSLAPRR
jgi:hypothetical protein